MSIMESNIFALVCFITCFKHFLFSISNITTYVLPLTSVRTCSKISALFEAHLQRHLFTSLCDCGSSSAAVPRGYYVVLLHHYEHLWTNNLTEKMDLRTYVRAASVPSWSWPLTMGLCVGCVGFFMELWWVILTSTTHVAHGSMLKRERERPERLSRLQLCSLSARHEHKNNNVNIQVR